MYGIDLVGDQPTPETNPGAYQAEVISKQRR
jgi:hypothetical protein